MNKGIVTDISVHRGPVIEATEALESALSEAIQSAVKEVGAEYFVQAVCLREERLEQQQAA